uniref:Gamma-aminobutyric acid receptor subunit beta n=1 Tax=Macrostomum lignano TaxID=282301 RepID=A0A1I8G8X9_9PLAT
MPSGLAAASPLLLLPLLLLPLLSPVRAQTQADDNSNSARLSSAIRRLTQNYDNRLRPNFGTKVLDIGMEVVIASFDSISEVNMDYTITMYLNQYWTDNRLAFDIRNANKSMTLTGEFASKIWVPDTFIANDKHSFLHDVTEQNKMVRLYGDGRIIYGMRFTTTLACMMDLHYYPLDVQNCTVEIESYGYPTEDVTMQWKNGQSAVDGADRVKMPQFTLEHFEVSTTTISLSTGSYQRLSLIFRLRRNVGFFVFQTYLPSILIVMLSWVSFWINHEATSARVALGITTVLTMTTISTGVRSSLPRISYVKAIDIYLVMCFVFVFAALLEYAMVNYTYWGARAKRKAKRLRDASSGNNTRGNCSGDFIDNSPINGSGLGGSSGGSGGVGGGIAGVGRSYLRQRRVTAGSLGGGGFDRRHQHQRAAAAVIGQQLRQRALQIRARMPRIKDVNKIDKYSRLAFPSLFVLFNLCYWCFYLLTG